MKANENLPVVLQCMELSPCHVGGRVSGEPHQQQKALKSLQISPHLPSSEKSPAITCCPRSESNGIFDPALCPRSSTDKTHQAGPAELKNVTQPAHGNFL